MENMKWVKREISADGTYKDVYMNNDGMLIGKEYFPRAATFEEVENESS